MQLEIFSIIFNYCELFGSLILIIIVHAKHDTEISMQNVVGFFQAKKKYFKANIKILGLTCSLHGGYTLLWPSEPWL